jgi:acetate kinase
VANENLPAPGSAGPDPLAVIGELTAALEGARDDLRSLRDELETDRKASEARDAALASSARRRGRIIAALAVSFCLDLLITAGFGWNTVRVNDAVTAGQQNAVSSCQQSNVNRVEDIAIWNRILGAQTTSAAAKAEIADVKRLVKIKDTPHVCN